MAKSKGSGSVGTVIVFASLLSSGFGLNPVLWGGGIGDTRYARIPVDIDNQGCVDIPFDSNVANRISTIENNGHCVVVFDGIRCTGNFRMITPELGPLGLQDNRFNFNDVTKSVASCSRISAAPVLWGGNVGDARYARIPVDIDSTRCVDIPFDANPANRISSMENNLHCVVLYDGAGCTGNYRIVEPSLTGVVFTDSRINFNDLTKSVSSCSQVKKSVPVLWGGSVGDNRYARIPIDVENNWCIDIPFSPDPMNRISSIENNGHCVILFDGYSCSLNSRRLTPDYSGVVFNDPGINFNDVTHSAASCDNFNLMPILWGGAIGDARYPRTPLDIFHNSCYNLPLEPDVGGRASNIETNGHCVILYDQSNCKGNSRTITPGMTGVGFNDPRINFNDLTQSASSCDPAPIIYNHKPTTPKPNPAHTTGFHWVELSE